MDMELIISSPISEDWSEKFLKILEIFKISEIFEFFSLKKFFNCSNLKKKFFEICTNF